MNVPIPVFKSPRYIEKHSLIHVVDTNIINKKKT